MATSDNKVLKMHVRNIRGARLDMIFYFRAIGGTKTLRVEDVGYNVGGHQGTIILTKFNLTLGQPIEIEMSL